MTITIYRPQGYFTSTNLENMTLGGGGGGRWFIHLTYETINQPSGNTFRYLFTP
jgi:hypothetical protein